MASPQQRPNSNNRIFATPSGMNAMGAVSLALCVTGVVMVFVSFILYLIQAGGSRRDTWEHRCAKHPVWARPGVSHKGRWVIAQDLVQLEEAFGITIPRDPKDVHRHLKSEDGIVVAISATCPHCHTFKREVIPQVFRKLVEEQSGGMLGVENAKAQFSRVMVVSLDGGAPPGSAVAATQRTELLGALGKFQDGLKFLPNVRKVRGESWGPVNGAQGLLHALGMYGPS